MDRVEYFDSITNMTDENIAIKILNDTHVDYQAVPIKIVKVMKNLKFNIGVVASFKNKPDFYAVVGYGESTNEIFHHDKIFIHERSVDIDDSQLRYAMAIAVSRYYLDMDENIIDKATAIYKDEINNVDDTREQHIARALLMPQKSLSLLLLSPMLQKMSESEKIKYVSNAFLVPANIAEKRIIETGMNG